MAVDTSIHPVQAKILDTLRFVAEARFSQLNQDQLTNDHFSFHVNQLLKDNLIAKSKDGTYFLTQKGQQVAHSIDREQLTVVKQGQLATLIVCINKDKQYLVQQRLRHPNYGYYGFVGGKILQGEQVEQAAERQLFSDTNLKGKLQIIGVHHEISRLETGEITKDKYYFVMKVEDLAGNFLEDPKGGKNMWMDLEKINQLENKLSGINIVLDLLQQNKFTFSEESVKQ